MVLRVSVVVVIQIGLFGLMPHLALFGPFMVWLACGGCTKGEWRLMKINIGCGFKLRKGYLNIDKDEHCSPDLLLDVSDGLTFDDNSVDEIFSSHALEHVQPEHWRKVISEMVRVTKNGGLWHFVLPFDNVGNRTNADHFRTFSMGSWSIFYDKPRDDCWYADWHLVPLHEEMNFFWRAFYFVIPLLHEVEFRFRLVKKK